MAAITEWIDHIESLGSTNAIAEFLRSEGIRGQRGRPTACPIAEFIRSKGALFAWVGGMHIAYGSSHAEHVTRDIPKVITQFMVRFDHGDFPDLIDNRTQYQLVA